MGEKLSIFFAINTWKIMIGTLLNMNALLSLLLLTPVFSTEKRNFNNCNNLLYSQNIYIYIFLKTSIFTVQLLRCEFLLTQWVWWALNKLTRWLVNSSSLLESGFWARFWGWVKKQQGLPEDTVLKSSWRIKRSAQCTFKCKNWN